MTILPSGNGGDGHTTGLPVLSVAFSPRGDALVTTSQDRTLCLWSVPVDLTQASRKLTRQWAHRTNCIEFHPNANTLAAGQSDGTIQFWASGDNLVEKDHIDNAHNGSVLDIAFNAAGDLLASAGEDSKVVMWNTVTNSAVWSITSPTPPDYISFSHDGLRLGVCSGGKLTLYHSATGAEESSRSSTSPIRTVAFQRNHQGLVAYGDDSGAIVIEQNEVTLKTLSVPQPIRWLAFNPTGRFLGVGCGLDVHGRINVIQRWAAEQTSFNSPFDATAGLFSQSHNAFAFSSIDHRIAAGTHIGNVNVS